MLMSDLIEVLHGGLLQALTIWRNSANRKIADNSQITGKQQAGRLDGANNGRTPTNPDKSRQMLTIWRFRNG
jgi:hypothetical protein